jgi:hypothetical protein
MPIGFPNRLNSTVANLFRFIDKLLSLNKATQNSEIVFVLFIMLNENYPLNDPRNDVKPHIDDLRPVWNIYSLQIPIFRY